MVPSRSRPSAQSRRATGSAARRKAPGTSPAGYPVRAVPCRSLPASPEPSPAAAATPDPAALAGLATLRPPPLPGPAVPPACRALMTVVAMIAAIPAGHSAASRYRRIPVSPSPSSPYRAAALRREHAIDGWPAGASTAGSPARTGRGRRAVAACYYTYGRKQRPAKPDLPPQEVLPPKLSLAIHSPALVSSMSSAPCPRDLEYSPAVPPELRISDPPAAPGVSPARPGAGIAPGPALLQALALLNHRLWPAT